MRAILGGAALCLALGAASPAAAQSWLYMDLRSSANSIPINGTAVLRFLIGRVGDPITLTNLTVSTTLPAGVSVVSSDTNDCGGTVSAAGTSIGLSGGSFNGSRVFCGFTVTVTATATGTYQIATSNLTSNETGSSIGTSTTLTVTPPLSTTTVTSSLNPSSYGQMVTFTATVTGTSGMTPTGTVTIKDGATALSTSSVGTGVVTFATPALSVGSHAITAEYSGDANNHVSASSPLTQTVSQGSSAITLVSSANPGAAGQAITFTATVTGPFGAPSGTVTFMDGGTALGTATLAGGVASFTTSALAVGAHSITASYAGDTNNVASTSAALAQTVNVPADSIKLRQLQVMATRVAAQTSGQAISGAVDAAIEDGFSDGSSELIAPSGNGLRVNFAAEPDARPSAVSESASPIDAALGLKQQPRSRTDDAFAALGYASVSKSPPRIIAAKEWLPWADVKYSGIDRWGSTLGATAAPLYGSHVNALAGLTRKLAPSFLVGAFGGYETFDYTSQELNGKLSGQGWTVGSYLGWKLAPSLRFDAAVAYSGIGYEGVAGRAQGNFDGRRWLVSSGLTGSYKAYGFDFEPSAKIYALWERENAYTDSLGTFQTERNFSTGRASGGGKVIYPFVWSDRVTLAPYTGLYGDYYFTRDDAEAILAAGGVPLASTPLLDGWSARAVGGVTAKFAGGGSISLGGELGGIGSDVQIWTFRSRAAVPF